MTRDLLSVGKAADELTAKLGISRTVRLASWQTLKQEES